MPRADASVEIMTAAPRAATAAKVRIDFWRTEVFVEKQNMALSLRFAGGSSGRLRWEEPLMSKTPRAVPQGTSRSVAVFGTGARANLRDQAFLMANTDAQRLLAR